MKIDKIVSYVLVAAIIVAVAAVAYIIISPAPGERFTEFYILGPNGKAGDYPANLTVGQSANLTVGVVNHEDATTSYQLVAKLNGNVLSNQSLNLKNEEKKEIPFTVHVNQTGNGQKLEFLLYKPPNIQQPYRYVDLLINVT